MTSDELRNLPIGFKLWFICATKPKVYHYKVVSFETDSSVPKIVKVDDGFDTPGPIDLSQSRGHFTTNESEAIAAKVKFKLMEGELST